jgi:broad specificity phosphatase PhoE
MPRLLLIRHGPSAHPAPPGWLDLAGVERYLDAYDAAGILDDAPPPAVVQEVAAARLVVASDLPRAIASAERLLGRAPGAVSPLLRESRLRVPSWAPRRAPLLVWATVMHLSWLLDRVRGVDAAPDARERARLAAAWCGEQCGEQCGEHGGEPDGAVAVVTHGIFRTLLARELVAAGWRAAPGRQTFANWSVWRYDLDPR